MHISVSKEHDKKVGPDNEYLLYLLSRSGYADTIQFGTVSRRSKLQSMERCHENGSTIAWRCSNGIQKEGKCIFHCVQTEIKTGDSTVTTLMRKWKKKNKSKNWAVKIDRKAQYNQGISTIVRIEIAIAIPIVIWKKITIEVSRSQFFWQSFYILISSYHFVIAKSITEFRDRLVIFWPKQTAIADRDPIANKRSPKIKILPTRSITMIEHNPLTIGIPQPPPTEGFWSTLFSKHPLLKEVSWFRLPCPIAT